MQRVIFNQKGGVGKSSITCNLAAISAAQGYKTLVIDLDVQGNSSFYLGIDTYSPDNRSTLDGTIAGLLKQSTGRWLSQKKKSIDFVRETPFENLHVIPSSPGLDDIEKELENRYKIYKLRDALQELDEDFDRVYIDTPPNYNFYSKSALIGANHVVVPFDCDSFSKQALYNLIDNIVELQEDHNKELIIEGIVVNQYNSQARFPQELIKELREEEMPVLDSFLSSSVKMKESHHAQKPLVHFAPSHKLSRQFFELYCELEGLEVESESNSMKTKITA